MLTNLELKVLHNTMVTDGTGSGIKHTVIVHT